MRVVANHSNENEIEWRRIISEVQDRYAIDPIHQIQYDEPEASSI